MRKLMREERKFMNVTEMFGCNVFNDEVMKNSLPKEVYRSLRRTIDAGDPLIRSTRPSRAPSRRR